MATRFVDAHGTEWEVWEVGTRPTLADAPPRRKMTGAEYLRFESATQRRRLARYPMWWQTLDGTSLAKLCEQADHEPTTVGRSWPSPAAPMP